MIVDVSPALGTSYYAVQELLTDEEREILVRVRASCEKEVIPVIGGYWDRAEFPFALTVYCSTIMSPAIAPT